MEEEILRTIPHRPPFLFLDRLVSCSDDEAVGEKTWEAGASFYEGHYPCNPITPGVLLCESVFQLGAVYLGKKMEKEGRSLAEVTPVLSRIREAKFRAPVMPGETVTVSVSFREQLANFTFLKGRIANAENRIAVQLEFALGLAAKA